MAVVVVVLGVGVCTVTDFKVNGRGFLCACIAVLSTSLQQIVSSSWFANFLFKNSVNVIVRVFIKHVLLKKEFYMIALNNYILYECEHESGKGMVSFYDQLY